MLVWAHVAVGYLLLSLGTRYYLGREPGPRPTLAAVAGALFPDLVDKPPALLVHEFPGRSAAHSVFGVAVVLGVAWLLARRDPDRRPVAVAWSVGVLSHAVVDTFDYVVYDHTLRYLAWPLLSQDSHVHAVSDLLRLVEPHPYVVLQTVLTVAAVALWVYDDRPGADLVRARLSRATEH